MKPVLFLSLFSVIACTSEEGVKVYNNAPEATITSHATGSDLLEAVEYTFVGQVSDGNHGMSELKVVWSTDTRELCEQTVPDASGATSCVATLETNDTQLKLQVTDPEGSATLASIDVKVLETAAPTIELISPVFGGSYYSDQLIQFAAIIGDLEDDPADLVYTWSSNVDGEISVGGSVDSDGSISGYANLTEGQHAISLQVTDATGKVTTEDVAITVGGENNSPLCDILTPESGSGFVVGQNIEFTATATDEDIDNSLLNISWESNVDGVFDTTAPNSAGEITLVYDGLSIGNHTISLKVEDEVGGICSDTVTLAVGTPPTLSITAPLSGDVVTLGDSVSFAGLVEDQEDIPSDISISWVSDIDGEFSTQASDSSGNIAFGYSELSAGEHNLSITATDSDGLTALVAQTLRINTPPPAPTITLSPTSAYTTDSITASATSEDADGDNVSFTYEWTSSSGGSYTGSLLPSTETSVGETWTVRVTPNDGYTDGDDAEASITILNSEPQLTAISITPSAGIYNDSTLTCSATAFDEDETLSPTYEWTVGSATYSGATLDLSTTSAMPNDTITCAATVEDSNGGSASLSTDVSVENRDPVISATSIAPTVSEVNDTLTCTVVGSDADGDTPTYVFSWSNLTTGDVHTSTTTSTDSATLDLTTVGVSVGDGFECTVTTSDGYGGSDVDTATIIIENSAPEFDVPVTVNIEPDVYVGDELTCSGSVVDLNDGAITPTYEWSVNGVVFATGQTYTVSAADVDVGDEIMCMATATDSHGEVETSCAYVTVQNSDPTMSAVSVSPSSPSSNDMLTCSATGTDLNDGALTAVYSWSNDTTGDTLGTTNTLQLDSSISSSNDVISCSVTFTDNNSASVSDSASVTVTNTPPPAPNASITPDPATTTDDLTVNATENPDAEGDSQTFVYQWFKNGQGTTYASQSIPSSETTKGDVWMVRVYADDGADQSTATEVSITISNTAPSITGATISGGTYNTDTLTCSATATDPDETLTITYTWSIDSVQIGMGASIDLATTAALPADDVVCTASVEDSDGETANDSATRTLDNRVPTAPEVEISPANPTAGQDDLTCVITTPATDADGQDVSYTYEWSRDGVGTSYTTDTIPAADVNTSEKWVCTVIPSDGITDGSAVSDYIRSSSACAWLDCDETLDLGNGQSIEFVNIMADSFMMGSPSTEVGRDSNEAYHPVTLTNDFLISTTEATQGMFFQLMGYQSYDGGNTSNQYGSYGVGDDYPAWAVSWSMAAAFSNELTNHHNIIHSDNLEQCYVCTGSGTTVECETNIQPIYECSGYRLPTEAEWEYAARAGTTAAIWTPNGGAEIPSGYEDSNGCSLNWTLSDGTNLGDLSWFCGNYAYYNSSYPNGSKEVATLIPNDFGLYDMNGNLWEATHDMFTGALGTDSAKDPARESGSVRSKRGGRWNNMPNSHRSAVRSMMSITSRGLQNGFRPVRSKFPGRSSAPEVSISPASPTDGVDDVVCLIDTESIDPDGISVTYTFTWTVDGIAYTGTPSTTTETGDTIDASETASGEVWECTVTPNDGTEDGYTGSASATIASACGLTDCDSNLDLGGGQSIDFVNISAGTFMMGSPSNEVGRYSDEDHHSVTLTNDFFVSTTEVTQGMYYQLMGYQAYDGQSTSDSSGSFGVGDDYPAYYVSWNMAADFSNHLTQQHNSLNGTSLTECYSCSNSGATNVSCSTAVQPIYECTGYRLPTEAEWEYAARAGTTAAFWTSNGGGNLPGGYSTSTYILTDGFDLRTYGWYEPTNNTSYGSKEVASLLSNDFGLYDMSGNTWEWTHDAYTAFLGTGSVTDPVRENNTYRVFRGGYWETYSNNLRSAHRNSNPSTLRSRDIGFRVGRTAP